MGAVWLSCVTTIVKVSLVKMCTIFSDRKPSSQMWRPPKLMRCWSDSGQGDLTLYSWVAPPHLPLMLTATLGQGQQPHARAGKQRQVALKARQVYSDLCDVFTGSCGFWKSWGSDLSFFFEEEKSPLKSAAWSPPNQWTRQLINQARTQASKWLTDWVTACWLTDWLTNLQTESQNFVL